MDEMHHTLFNAKPIRFIVNLIHIQEMGAGGGSAKPESEPEVGNHRFLTDFY